MKYSRTFNDEYEERNIREKIIIMPELMVKKASIEIMRNSSRAFILLKPDAVFRQQIGEGIRSLSKRFEDKGIKHRIIAPMLANLSDGLVDILYKDYVDNEWFKQGFKPFMRGVHPDMRIPSSPVAAFILEMKNIPGQDMYAILRSDDVIGPTNPFEIIKKYPERAEQIKNSVRFNLIGKDLIKPFDGLNCPMMNRIHCSSNEEDAEKELSGFYLSIFEYILPYYSDDAANYLRGRLTGTGINYELNENDLRVPLLTDPSGHYSLHSSDLSIIKENDLMKFHKGLSFKKIYKDFLLDHMFEIFEQMQGLIPMTMKLEEDFFA